MGLASKIKSSIYAWLCAMIVMLCLAETCVGKNLTAASLEPGQSAPATQAAISDFYDASQYDASDYAVAAKTTVPTIGGRVPINSKLAGQTHPSGIKFTDQGFPDFSPVSKAQAQIQGLTGNYAKDAAMANQAVGLKATPSGYVWHHVEDGATMQLLPQTIHNATRHTGGAAVIRNGGSFDP